MLCFLKEYVVEQRRVYIAGIKSFKTCSFEDLRLLKAVILR